MFKKESFMIKPIDLYGMFESFGILGEYNSIPQFSLWVALNKKEIKSFVGTIEEINITDKEFIVFSNFQKSLIDKLCSKDEKGLPIVFNNQYTFSDENKITFESELNNLKEKYKDVIKKEEDRREKYNEILKTNTEIYLYKIDYKYIPENIKGNELENVINLINWDS